MRISIAVVKRFLDRYGSSVKMKNGVDVADGVVVKVDGNGFVQLSQYSELTYV